MLKFKDAFNFTAFFGYFLSIYFSPDDRIYLRCGHFIFPSIHDDRSFKSAIIELRGSKKKKRPRKLWAATFEKRTLIDERIIL